MRFFKASLNGKIYIRPFQRLGMTRQLAFGPYEDSMTTTAMYNNSVVKFVRRKWIPICSLLFLAVLTVVVVVYMLKEAEVF